MHCFSYSFSFFMVAIASQYSCHQRSCMTSRIIVTSGFQYHVIMCPNNVPQHAEEDGHDISTAEIYYC